MKKWLAILILTLAWTYSRAQDPQFSQFYAAPLYLNPAFAGSTDLTRVGFNQRIQWPALAQTIQTSSAFIDHQLYDRPHGFGAIIVRHRESVARLTYSYFAAQYSYKMDISDQAVLRVGVEGRVFQKDADFEELIFSNQIDINSGTIGGNSGEFIPGQFRKGGLDLGAGAVIFTDHLWLGASVFHINQPDDSFIDGASVISRLYSIHTGYKFSFKSGRRLRTLSYSFQERSFTLAANFKAQGPFAQLDFGFQTYLEPIYAGVWYRGIPTADLGGVSKDESVIVLAGLQLRAGFNIGYSYDITVSQLRGATGGAHEIAILYLFGNQRKFKRRGTKLPCTYSPYL